MKKPSCTQTTQDSALIAETFMNNSHRVIHRRPPVRWNQGFPLGNGVVGAMIWGDGNPLALTLDHAELWDLRSNNSYQDHPDFNYMSLCRLVEEKRFKEVDDIFERRIKSDNPIGPTKISIGRMELRINSVGPYTGVLDLDKAVFTGTLKNASDEHSLCAFVPKDLNLICLQVSPAPAGSEMDLVPLCRMNEKLAELGHPEPVILEEGELRSLVQSIPQGWVYAVAWNPNGPDYFIAVETGATYADALAKAQATWRRGSSRGFDALRKEHEQTGRQFWSASAVRLPEIEKEILWYYGVYLLASSARKGFTPPGLQGLWAMDGVIPPWWGAYAADMNIQETFWPAAATGHLELLDCWCDYMKAGIETLRSFTRKFFGAEGVFWPGGTVANYTLIYGYHTCQFAWSSTGWLSWLVWLRWRYSLDESWLKDTGYPILAETFKFYRDNLRKESDGRLHIPLSGSPEYDENQPTAWAKDPNIDIALIRRCCDWIVEFERALNIQDLTPAAREIQAHLVSYALTDEKVLCLWPGKPLDKSHRHPSHLMAIHPAMDLTIDGSAEEREIINASVSHYLSLGQWLWAGHTYAQMISFAAVLGRSGWAYDCLDQFHKRWTAPNGLHFNFDFPHSGMTAYDFYIYEGEPQPPFTMEANCGVSAGISDMLLQGWNDVIRVFPAVPDHWRNAAFADLRTEGAFSVSAIRIEGQTRWVRVRAGADRVMQLKDPFEGREVTIAGGCLERQQGLFSGFLQAEQEITLSLAANQVTWPEAIRKIRESDNSRLGLR